MAMGSNYATVGLSCTLVLMMVGFVSSDLAKEREECASQLVALSTCLPYVSGTAKAPTVDCCSGLKQVVDKSKKCLCILVKDRNDPSLGLKINTTLALSLPDICHSPANVSKCPDLLHLAPNSPDAQIFEQFANSSTGTSTVASVKGSPTTSGSSAGSSAQGGRGKGGMLLETVGGLWVWFLASVLILGV